MEFLMTLAYGLIIACGCVALLYGLVMIRSVLSLSTGNDKMRQIAAAIQEGASAYLNGNTRLSLWLGSLFLFY